MRTMAKPIESIPTLKDEDARIFLDDIRHPENITELEKVFFEDVKKMKSAIKTD